eukprot:1147694-Pelagomonas_calceolata.AAC.12
MPAQADPVDAASRRKQGRPADAAGSWRRPRAHSVLTRAHGTPDGSETYITTNTQPLVGLPFGFLQRYSDDTNHVGSDGTMNYAYDAYEVSSYHLICLDPIHCQTESLSACSSAELAQGTLSAKTSSYNLLGCLSPELELCPWPGQPNVEKIDLSC